MVTRYPVFVFCGRDYEKRKLILELDPDNKYDTKALLPFLGKRVVDWQLEELRKSPYVEDLYLLGITEEMAKFDYPVHYVDVPTASTYAEKLLAGIDYLRSIGKDNTFIVVSSSDTPGITVEGINQFFEAIEDLHHIDYVQSVVPDDITKKVFPDHQRVVGKFSDIHVYPGELFAMSEYGMVQRNNIISEIGGRRRNIKTNKRTKRKSAITPIVKLVLSRPGTWFLILKFMLGKLSLAGGEKLLSRIAKGTVRAVIISDAAFGMDMDLPEDYEKLKRFVSKTKNVPYMPGVK
ncbi:MAG: NTP transferase domain-containing protein [Candidatus Heimdallarchaeaceae archaeon]